MQPEYEQIRLAIVKLEECTTAGKAGAMTAEDLVAVIKDMTSVFKAFGTNAITFNLKSAMVKCVQEFKEMGIITDVKANLIIEDTIDRIYFSSGARSSEFSKFIDLMRDFTGSKTMGVLRAWDPIKLYGINAVRQSFALMLQFYEYLLEPDTLKIITDKICINYAHYTATNTIESRDTTIELLDLLVTIGALKQTEREAFMELLMENSGDFVEELTQRVFNRMQTVEETSENKDAEPTQLF